MNLEEKLEEILSRDLWLKKEFEQSIIDIKEIIVSESKKLYKGNNMRITSEGKKLVVDCEGMQFNLKNGQDNILTVDNKNHEVKEDTEINNGYFVHPGSKTFGSYMKGDDRYRYVCPKDETTGVYLDTEKNRIVLIDNTPVG